MKRKFNYIDLFCGCGGLSLGFDKAGFNNVLAVEFNPVFAKTYKENFNKHNIIIDDIKNVNNKKIMEELNGEKVDVIIGGCPCQGFSIAGNIARNIIDDPRNYLFKEFVRFVDLLKPTLFIFENVANLEKYNNGKAIANIEKSFENIGYTVKHKVLLASEYEVPQDRRRIFIVGQKGKFNNFEYPKKSSKVITIKDAIDDLPKLESGQKSNIPNHNAMNHSEQMLEKMKYVKDGGDRLDIPEKIRPTTGDIRKYIRYNSNKPSICITGDMRKVFHYSQNRALTCRELARLQTFPDSFKFFGNSSEIQQQIGNAVPVELARRIALQTKEVLSNE